MTEQSSEKGYREHLSKDQRLPRCYKDAEKVLKTAKTCQGNIKTILYNTKFRGGYFNKIYALTHNVLKNSQLLDKIIEETQLPTKEPYLKKEIAQIMIYDLVLGKGQLSGKSKPVLTILKYKDDIERTYHCLQKAGIDRFMQNVVTTIPRYARVNTLLTTMSDVLADLKKSGYYQKEYEEDISEDLYLDIVKNLNAGEFLIDYHFKDLLVFPNRENLRAWDLYNQGHIFLQDKSSCIPVSVLAPEPGSNVLDACAAPGMKTVHLAAIMKNKGQLFAYEKDSERFNVLKNTLTHGNVKVCKMFCKDFRTVNPTDDTSSSIDYILVDPTCSGSGMVSRMDAVTDTEDSKNEGRLQKLAGFQIVLLKHALKFPNVKRVVYSTCSITEEENEYVVHEVLNDFQNQFKLMKIMPNWSVRGSANYEYGNLCLRAYPKNNLTNGFFVAMFERIEPNGANNYSTSSKMFKHKKNKGERKNDCEDEGNFYSSVSQKQHKRNNCTEINVDNVNSEQKEEKGEIYQSETHVKKKHKKKHKSDEANMQVKKSNSEKKSDCEDGDNLCSSFSQKHHQRNNYTKINVENVNSNQTGGIEETYPSETHVKKKLKKKHKSSEANMQKNNIEMKSDCEDDFYLSTLQKQHQRNNCIEINVDNVNSEQKEEIREIYQSETDVKRKRKKKHKSDEVNIVNKSSSEKKSDCEDDFYLSNSQKHQRNNCIEINVENVNSDQTEKIEETYQSETQSEINQRIKKKCKKKHKSDKTDMQYKKNKGKKKNDYEDGDDFCSSASQKEHQRNKYTKINVECKLGGNRRIIRDSC